MSLLTYQKDLFTSAGRWLRSKPDGRVLWPTFACLILVILVGAILPSGFAVSDRGSAAGGEDERSTQEALVARARTAYSAEIERALPDLDAVTLETLTENLTQLAESNMPDKRAALVSFAAGDRDAALGTLAAIVTAQRNNGDETAVFETLSETGALTFLFAPSASYRAYTEALKINSDDPAARYHLGLLFQQSRETENARSQFKSIAEDPALEGTAWQAAAEGNLGILAIQAGNMALAEYHVLKSLQYNERLNRPKALGLQHANLGVIGISRGNAEAANSNLKKALAIFEGLGEEANIARTLGNLGLVAQSQQKYEAAEGYLTQSAQLSRKLGDARGLAMQLGVLARTKRLQGDLTQAENYYKQSITLNDELGNELVIGAQYASLGGIEYDRQNIVAACSYWRESVKFFERSGSAEGTSQVQALLDQASCTTDPG
ncbi:tetratricopeptide repeat protein [Parvularcula sp. IMCC14364]|uniref:tetratricopeptide repeat protein n=1 Tax=Parvularcula sp. IMCC14364 TaxID=3067902 RepID=UPI0027413B48|nr:tetratricopeptide repeat protein [Parvularcula sp. IMCC14364]